MVEIAERKENRYCSFRNKRGVRTNIQIHTYVILYRKKANRHWMPIREENMKEREGYRSV